MDPLIVVLLEEQERGHLPFYVSTPHRDCKPALLSLSDDPPPPPKPSLIEWLQQLAVSHSLRLAFDHSLSVILGVTRSIGLPPLFTPSLPSQVSSHFVPPCLSHTFYLSLLSQKSDQ